MSYTTFCVGASGGKDKTTSFLVTVFGRRGKALAKHITKGHQVLVGGRITVGNHGRLNIVADRVMFGAQAKDTKKTSKKAK